VGVGLGNCERAVPHKRKNNQSRNAERAMTMRASGVSRKNIIDRRLIDVNEIVWQTAVESLKSKVFPSGSK
jgi:hypothetical protein